MEFPYDLVPDDPRLVSLLDPYLYLRQADVALLQGNREQAITLITKIYLAFDLLAGGCDEFSEWGTIPRERSN
jgi:hypothetical protein